MAQMGNVLCVTFPAWLLPPVLAEGRGCVSQVNVAVLLLSMLSENAGSGVAVLCACPDLHRLYGFSFLIPPWPSLVLPALQQIF